MKLLVLLNGSAGTLANSATKDEPERIRRAFEAAGHEAEVRDVGGANLETEARAAIQSDFDAVIAGGGDGTLNAIANVVAGSGKAYGVLPLGTHNHFAKDLGVPLELEPAIQALAHGGVTDLPVAEVNDRIFLNFSALGFHPELVRHRDAQRKTLGRRKWLAMAVAFFKVFARFPILRIELQTRERRFVRYSPSVIVCNNPHQMRVFGVEDASVPERGLLNVYVATSRNRFGLVWLFLRALFGKLEQTHTFEVLAMPEVTIHTRQSWAHVSIDGEVTDMRPPLRYTIRQTALRVIVPAKEESA
ncbi:MAG TPA: diacylglycerol kinase family protein [Tepidisphaeraceae bacterium]|nr:diacylglycerol kinase family protein [Tepidisphaeraceae bacterium]